MTPAKGYADGPVTVHEQIAKLESYITSFPQQVSKFPAGDLLKKPAKNKWSKKEIIGHLIDSAINNLKRFTDAQVSARPYKMINYQQVELVIVNNYQQLPIEHLLGLWQMLNKQIVFVVNAIPGEKLYYEVDPQYESGEMKTLAWVICDYVAHMEHHFKQIMPNDAKKL